MRVITGTAKGKKLKTLEGRGVRPTTDKIKESIFNIIQFDVSGSVFLDLFGGSGQIGIEALSRGAAEVVFVDMSRASIEVIKQNLDTTGFSENAKVYCMKAENFLKSWDGCFDIVYLDPPYETGILQSILPIVSSKVKDTGLIICENPLDEELSEEIGEFNLSKQFKYGKIKISIYR